MSKAPTRVVNQRTPTAWRALEPATAALVGLGAELERLLDHVARRTGSLSFSQYLLLGALRAVHPAPREPWELGRALGAGSAQVRALLDQLERSGLVVRDAHGQDRRRRLIRLTDVGLRRVEEVGVRVRAIEELVLARAFGPRRGARACRGRPSAFAPP